MTMGRVFKAGSKAQQFAAHVGGLEQLRSLATRFADRQIPLMPIKGVLIREAFYDDPVDRPVKDLDILVPSGRYEQAQTELESLGYRLVPESTRNHFQCSFRKDSALLPVDLHRSLFEECRYSFATQGIFDRAQSDEGLFGCQVHRMRDLDIVAHLIGKLGSDHVGFENKARLQDLSQVASRSSFSSQDLVDHMESLGLSRAGRYVRGLFLPNGHLPSGLEGLDELPADPLADLFAGLALRANSRWGHASLPAKITALGLAGSTIGSLGLISAGVRRQIRRRTESARED